jgi:hypothetical protein
MLCYSSAIPYERGKIAFTPFVCNEQEAPITCCNQLHLVQLVLLQDIMHE